MGVAVAVGIAAAVKDHGIVKQRIAVDILNPVELLEKLGHLLYIPQIDIRDLVDPVLAIHVMSEIVMAFRDADLVEGAVAAVVGKQKGCNACRVALERQHQNVKHKLEMLAIVAWDSGRRLHARILDTAKVLSSMDTRFDFADAG